MYRLIDNLVKKHTTVSGYYMELVKQNLTPSIILHMIQRILSHNLTRQPSHAPAVTINAGIREYSNSIVIEFVRKSSSHAGISVWGCTLLCTYLGISHTDGQVVLL